MATRWSSVMLGALVLMGSGCMKNTYITGKAQGGGVYTQKAGFFLWGLVGQKTVDMGQVCPGGVAWFQNRRDFIDGVVGCVTCGLYQPVTIEVRCSGGQSWLAVPDAEQGLTWFHPIEASSPDVGGAL